MIGLARVFGFLFLFTLPVLAQSSESELFEKVFGRSAPQVLQDFDASLLIDGNYAGNVLIQFNPYTNDIIMPARELFDVMSRVLIADEVFRLTDFQDSKGQIRTDDLEEAGFRVIFNPRWQRLIITSPLSFRDKVKIDLGGGRFPDANRQRTTPSNVSGYLNMRHEINSGDDDSYRLDLDANVNVHGWAFQSETDLNSLTETFTFTGARVLHDNTDSKVRFIAGSHAPFSRVSLTPEPVLGIGIEKNWENQPNYNPFSTYHYSLHLDETKRVRIMINDVEEFEQTLDVGRYEFTEFPFTYGKNKVDVYIVNENTTELIHRDYFFDDAVLLQLGQNEFNVSAGYAFDNPQELHSFNESEGQIYAEYRYGFQKFNNATLFTTTKRFNTVLGAGWQMSNELGIWEAIFARSENDSLGVGYRTSLSLTGFDTNYFPWSTFERYSLIASVEDDRFTDQSFAVKGPQTWIISPRMEVGLMDNIYSSVQVNYSHTTNPGDHALNVASSFFFRLFDFQWQFSYRVGESIAEEDIDQFRITAIWIDPSRANRVEVSRRSENRQGNLSWSYYPGKSRSTLLQTQAQYISDDNRFLQSTFRYERNFISGLHQVNEGIESEAVTLFLEGQRGRLSTTYSDRGGVANTQLAVESAVVFADGQVAVGEPVDDSFVIFYTAPKFKHGDIKFTRFGAIDMFGSAAITDLQSYRESPISVTDADVGLGADLGNLHYVLAPTAFSGTAIEIGRGGDLFVMGQLVDELGEPIKYLPGELRSTDGIKSFFTNSQGQFSLIGMSPGTYTMSFFTSTYADFQLTIPESSEDIVKLKTITLTEVR